MGSWEVMVGGGVNYDTLHTDAPAVMVMMVMVE